MSSTPDYYMTSTDLTGEWTRLRACWFERHVAGPHHGQYAVVRIDPPGLPKNQSAAVDTILVSPKHEGKTLFPPNDDPLAVYVYIALRAGVFDQDVISGDDVRIEAWCELYSSKEEAQRVATEG